MPRFLEKNNFTGCLKKVLLFFSVAISNIFFTVLVLTLVIIRFTEVVFSGRKYGVQIT